MIGTLTFETRPTDKMLAAAIAESGRSFTGGKPSFKRRALRVGGWVVIFLIFLGLFQIYDPALTDTFFLVLMAGAVGMLLGLGIAAIAQRAVLNRMAAEAGELGPCVIELSETQITEHSEGQVVSMGLHRVRRVLRIDGGTVIRFAAFLFLVPDADLPDGISPESFQTLLTERVTRAGGEV